MEVPQAGIEPMPQQRPQLLQWQCWTLNLLHYRETSGLPFRSGRAQRNLPVSTGRPYGHTQGAASKPEVSDPFYYPPCGRNSARCQHPLIILSPHQRPVQHTHPSSFFLSNAEITSKFLDGFLTEICKHFVFVILSIKLSSGGVPIVAQW